MKIRQLPVNISIYKISRYIKNTKAKKKWNKINYIKEISIPTYQKISSVKAYKQSHKYKKIYNKEFKQVQKDLSRKSTDMF